MGKEQISEIIDKKKSHRDRHSGRKAEKKKGKKEAQNPVLQELSDKQRNPKAFAFNSAVRAERRFRRKQDIETKKQHIPLIDRTPLEPPPILVVVVGPPKVGKSTLINNLIKLFTRCPLTDIKGPVTVVMGKKRRLTLIECNNDINSMIDLAKIADLVLLLCDASFGFEMEVFEFLNICQVHGMPRIMGVLTHLDTIKNNKTLKTTKKTLKHRFWTEVYAGAKLFYLSGILHGEYLRNEIKNLGRFISVMKFRPLTWRSTHSYLLGDRYEDLTNQETIRNDPKCDRTVSLYGYVRGVPLKNHTFLHVAGMSDFKMRDITYLPDPCPLPEQVKKRALIEKEKLIYAPFSGVGGIVYDKDAVYVELGGSHSHGKRERTDESDIVANLIESKETLDAKMQHSELQLFTGGEKIVAKDFRSAGENSEGGVRLGSKGPAKAASDLETELETLRNDGVRMFEEERVEDSGRVRRKVVFNVSDEELSKTMSSDTEDSDDETEAVGKVVTKRADNNSSLHEKIANALRNAERNKSSAENRNLESKSDSEDAESDFLEKDEDDLDEENDKSSSYSGSDVEGGDLSVKWKQNLTKKARDSFLNRQSSTQNLMKLVYGQNTTQTTQETEDANMSADEEIGGLFKIASRDVQKSKIEKDSLNLLDSSLCMSWNDPVRDWTEIDNKVLITNCFVTGKWKESEDAAELLKLDDASLSDDSDVFGDFEDLETGEKHTAPPSKRKRTDDDTPEPETPRGNEREALAEKKRKLKEKFDAEYDNADTTSFYDDLKTNAEKQAQLNKSVFENMDDHLRVQIEGFRAGMYVRMELENVPAEFVINFDPAYPLVIGALNPGEENVGFVNVRLKKHRWYKKILKTSDPLVISLGWRRFQTLPLFSKLEDDLKFRYLKYTPAHISCNAHFWGPITPQGTGFLALQNCDSDPDMLKRQGFRIAATGVVQELDKSTKIMKKLTLIGYPLKIYKKTAFIKGMFNSALEVAKFEGARIKTVSGIRGQIKKAVSKPEGCFRASFEDKIQLSDIVSCRTWYKVDVPQFYTSITTLLLPPDKKNSWKGVRTTGEIKREKGIKNEPNKNSLYMPIEREAKVFKPLVIPNKLQEALPYRDKPKHCVKDSEKKKTMDRIAVIKEPHEQKVTSMIKMIKAAYEHKQEQQKQQMKERLEKHRQTIEAQENKKAKKLKEQKKAVFRAKSKAKIREESKASKR